MHEGIVRFQFHNVLSWDVNRVALKRNWATFYYKYFLEHLYTAANNILKGFSKDNKGEHHILLNLVMHSLIDYIGKSQYMIIQIKTAAVLSISLQWPTAVSADYQSCQINTLGQLSEGGDFLFSVCNLEMFHKSLLCICFLLLNLKPASVFLSIYLHGTRHI